jgi:hypothetical protein
MNHEVIEIAMQEIMEEQKENKKIAEQLIGKIDSLSALVESLKDQRNIMTHVLSPDSNALREVQTELGQLKELMRSQPKNVIHEKRFLFFPEHYAKEYYSVILRWVFYIILATYTYFILKYIIDHWSR